MSRLFDPHWDVIDYVNNEFILYLAKMRIQYEYIKNPNDGSHGDRDVILNSNCKMLYRAVIDLPYIEEKEPMYKNILERFVDDVMNEIEEEQEYHNLGIIMEN